MQRCTFFTAYPPDVAFGPLLVEICPMSHLLAPSLLAADFGTFFSAMWNWSTILRPIGFISMMDGLFVLNISFGMPMHRGHCAFCQKTTRRTFDDCRSRSLHPDIRGIGCRCSHRAHRGVPPSSLHACSHSCCWHEGRRVPQSTHLIEGLRDVVSGLDLVCLMSVNPGFGGQSFIERILCQNEGVEELAR